MLNKKITTNITKEKVYIVKCERGNYEDYIKTIHSAYKKKEDAMNEVYKLNEKANKIKNKAPKELNRNGMVTKKYLTYYLKHRLWLDNFKASIEEHNLR